MLAANTSSRITSPVDAASAIRRRKLGVTRTRLLGDERGARGGSPELGRVPGATYPDVGRLGQPWRPANRSAARTPPSNTSATESPSRHAPVNATTPAVASTTSAAAR